MQHFRDVKLTADFCECRACISVDQLLIVMIRGNNKL